MGGDVKFPVLQKVQPLVSRGICAGGPAADAGVILCLASRKKMVHNRVKLYRRRETPAAGVGGAAMNNKRVRQMNTSLLRKLTSQQNARYLGEHREVVAELVERQNYTQRFAPL